MVKLDISHEELQKTILQLDQALYNHTQWYESLTRDLICRLPHDTRDIEDDAHRKCVFGQWYYGRAPGNLGSHPGFVALGIEHERIHRYATKLMTTVMTGETVHPLDYDNFNNSINKFHLELQTMKHEIEDLLYNHDTLTRAYSRIGLLTKLRELQDFVKRNIQSCCIAMMDLDHFKSVNDTHGHLAGDHVLTSIANHIMARIRPYDKLFRYGGEEFLITMPHTDLQSGSGIIERLRKGIAACGIFFEDKEIHITVSFGLTLLDPDVTVEQTIERADLALYAAKSSGRNCLQIWDPSLDSRKVEG